MGIRYPGSNMQELNLDWVLSTVKENTEKVDTQLHDLTELEEKVDGAVYSVDHMTVEAETLQPGEDATATKSIINGHINIEFGIPKGEKGDPGQDGQDGAPGPAPTDAQVATAVNTWLNNNIDPDSGYALDRTLSLTTAAAPADMVGYVRSRLANKFAATANYYIGDMVFYNDVLYQFEQEHPAGAWIGTDVSTGTTARIGDIIYKIMESLCPQFDSTQAYTAGDYVIRLNRLYQFVNNQAANTAWTPANVQTVNLTGEISDLKSQIFNYDEAIKPTITNTLEAGSFGSTGNETTSTKACRTKLNYHVYRDKITSVSCDNGYNIYIRAWDYNSASKHYVGFYHEDGTFSTTGTQKLVKFFDLTKYPQYVFRFFLCNEAVTNMGVSEAEQHFHMTEAYLATNDEQISINNQDVDGNRTVNFLSGAFDKQSDGVWRYAPWYPNRVVTKPISLNPGDIVHISSTKYKWVINGFTGEMYDVASQFWTANSFTTTPQEYTAHSSSKICIKFALASDDTESISPEDVKKNTNISISTYASRQDSILKGRKISVLGDSISSYNGYVPSDALYYYPTSDVDNVNRMYWEFLALQENMVIDTINAYAGSTVATKWSTNPGRPPFYDSDRLNNLGNPDYIIVYGGVNDYGGNPLGDYPNPGQYTNMFEFRTAYAYVLSQLKTIYPSARIICMTLLTVNSAYNEAGVFPPKQNAVRQSLATDTTTHFLYEFNESIVELAKRYECSVCDISDCMNYYNTANESVDGVHPKMIIHNRIKEKLLSVLKTLG